MYKFTGFNEKANRALNSAVEIAENFGHTFIGSEHLLLGLVREDNGVATTVLNAKGVRFLNCENIVKKTIGIGIPTVLTPNDFTARCKRIIENALAYAKEANCENTTSEHLLFSLIKEGESSASYIIGEIGVNSMDILDELKSKTATKATYTQSAEPKKHHKSKTPNLDKFAQDLTTKAMNSNIDPVIGREKEIERVIQILARRSKNNPCLIGEPGVGKTAIAEGLALKIALGDVPELLANKKLLSLDLTSMVAGTKYRGDFEERIKSCIDEVVHNPNIILFIDEVHNLIGTGSAEGAVDAANILKPSLARSELQVIGATTLKEYTKHIEKDPALERRFQPIQVEQPSQTQAIEILNGIKSKYELHHDVIISQNSIKFAVELSARYINDRFLPDKAIDLLDEACSKVRLRSYCVPPHIKKLQEDLSKICLKKSICIDEEDFDTATKLREEEKALILKINSEKTKWKEQEKLKTNEVTTNEIAQIVSSWTGIPLTQLSQKESTRLLELESILHETIIGQDDAVSAVTKAIRRSRSGINDPKKPLGSFIFLGPTGVGKTRLCKALAVAMFGDENALIRFDMSEFMQKQNISRLIGSPPGYVGYEESGQLTQKVRRKPYCIVLFDEIEKAHPDVFNIFLQILDDGQLTDSQGIKVSFLNTVIIMTSNLGAKTICGEGRSIGFSSEKGLGISQTKISERVLKELKKTFKPEFLNRVDEMIVFHKLSQEHIEKITRIILAGLQTRLKAIEIELEFSDEIVSWICKNGFDADYGARAIKREIQRKIEDSLSEELLSGNIKNGKKYLCTLADETIKFEEKEAAVFSV
ncbi:MAG: ATP-dependent Clp protease ATP-binding subunit [Clostridia bacterium]